MRKIWITTLIFAICSALALAYEHAAATQQGTNQQEALRQKAEASSGGERAKIFVELARQEMEAADQSFTAGDVEKAHAQVKQSEADAEKGTDAALSTGKRLKATEIELRKLQKRTEDIRHSLALDDRPALETMEKRLEELRRSLLQKMFGGGKDKP